MKNPRVARRYANAFMAVADELKAVDTVAADLDTVSKALTGSREFRLFLASPVVSDAKKSGVLKAVFDGRVTAVTSGFMDLLVRKHREFILQEVIDQFFALRDEMRGIMTVDVSSVTPLERSQEDTLARELSTRTGKTIRFRMKDDPAIKGGLIVRIGDTVLDASVRRQLERLRERFAGTARISTL